MLDRPTPYNVTDGGSYIHYYRDTAVNIYYDVPTLWELSKGFPRFLLTPEQFNAFLNRDSAWSGVTPLEGSAKEHHWERLLEADTNFPVMVRWTESEMLIVDGYHRVSRAYVDGLSTLEAVDVSALLIQAEIRSDYVWPEDHQ